MADSYNPIIRNFCRVRSVLTSRLSIERDAVRPRTSLSALLPVNERKHVWRALQEQLPRLPALELSGRDRDRNAWTVLMATLSFTLCARNAYALLSVIPLAVFVHRASLRRAVHFPYDVRTVGELVICGTHFGDHEDSGYHWTRNEIRLKVRMTIAESVGLPLQSVQSDTKFLRV